jgi:hypothetical protein
MTMRRGQTSPPIGEAKMERSAAIKKLGKLLGKSLGYRINDKAPTPEERAAAKAELTLAIAERNTLKEKRDERHRAILAADAKYQSLHATHAVASERVDKLLSITRHFKITVGISNSMCFLIKAEGDSWEDVIAKIENANAKSANVAA